jgi:cytochrome oxidase Cu insertion factor (SCO1/SenC/PrrC family)
VLDGYDVHVTKLPDGDFEHVSRVYLIDASGNIRQIYAVSFLDPARVEGDINSLLAERRPAVEVRSQ